MYKLTISDKTGDDFRTFTKVRELYFPDSTAVCSLIQQLSNARLTYHLESFEFATCDDVDELYKSFDLTSDGFKRG